MNMQLARVHTHFVGTGSQQYGVGPCREFTILSFAVNKHKSVYKGYLIIYVPSIDIIFTIISHAWIGTFYTLDWWSLVTAGVHLCFKANSLVGYWDYQIQPPTIISTGPHNCPIFAFIIIYIIMYHIYIIGL